MFSQCAFIFQIKFSEDGVDNVTETITNYHAGNLCASANAHMDVPGMGLQQDVKWFHTIDVSPDGIVSYYFGVSLNKLLFKQF